jgi:hypothetical protein
MTRQAPPYAVPKKIDPKLKRVLAYWESLKRAENAMPFWDDVKPSSLPDMADSLMLINVFTKPERFRLATIGRRLTNLYGETVSGKFIDDLEAKRPFDYLRSQCSATVESRAPTYYEHSPAKLKKSRPAAYYSRLLLPLWGEGSIRMLLGAAVLHRKLSS